jgi:hypothetical protein
MNDSGAPFGTLTLLAKKHPLKDTFLPRRRNKRPAAR